jgi:carnitine-CoA ligase
MTVREFWDWRVRTTPGADFLITEDARWSYADFDRWVNRLANGLRREGIGAGSRVALLLESGPDLLRIQLALQKLGAVWVPLIPTSTAAEAAHVVDHSRADALITTAGALACLKDAEIPLPRTFAVDDHGPLPFDGDDDSGPPSPDLDPWQPMAIMYTSGSTGKPKGVVQPNVGFATVARAVSTRLGTGPADRWYCVMPLFHSGATHLIVGPAIAGGSSIVLRDRFSRTKFWDDVRTHGATASLLMPAMLAMLLSDEPRSNDRENPLRVAFSHIRRPEFVERFDVDVCPGWGMTETLGVGALTPAGFSGHRPQMIGLPNPPEAEFRVVDDRGEPLGTGERGELCLRHPQVFTEYYRDPENTAETLRGGWLCTGDLGSIDEDGIVYFHGRIKNVIKRAGENIAGEELETVAMDHPAVEECVVGSVPDPIWTEEVHATIVVLPGAEIDERDVAGWYSERLAAWKVPRYIRLVREPLPKLANGKIDRLAVNAAAEPRLAWDREGASGGLSGRG